MPEPYIFQNKRGDSVLVSETVNLRESCNKVQSSTLLSPMPKITLKRLNEYMVM